MATVATRAASARVPMVRPNVPPPARVLEKFQEILRSGQLTNGPQVRRLEDSVCEFLDVPHCVAISSCTAGLMMVMRAMELAGEVILPSFTFFATGHALLWNNLVPVFCDCEPGSFNIDPERVEALITPRTSAILAVHMYGNPANVERLEEIAKRRRLALIFDSAHAFGSLRNGRRAGGFGDAEVFSLSPTKVLTAGEGGLVTTHNARLAATLRKARNYGDPGSYDCDLPGLNARMTEFHATLALESLRGVDREIFGRNEIAEAFSTALAGLPGITFQQVRADDWSTRKDFCLIVDETACPLTRDELAAVLREENVDTRFYFYPPMHRQKLYRGFHRGGTGLEVTDRLSSRVLNLPIYASLSPSEITRITSTIRTAIESA
jgi:dTDP-4-amino-4,6-dideoxygalactose transaminase